MAAAITAPDDDLVEYGFRRVIITITAVMCALLEIVDTTIVNVALTDMRGSLGATLTDVAWVITAYAIANVIVIPMTSWLSQQFGRRNYFAVSIIIFTVSSFLCGNADNIWELVVFRFIQGLGGGALLVGLGLQLLGLGLRFPCAGPIRIHGSAFGSHQGLGDG